LYVWIWRKLPFSWPWKIVQCTVLILSVVALLWFVAFPWAEPILPFDDVQVSTDGGDGGDGGVDGPAAPEVSSTSSASSTEDPHDLPYSDESNNPHPTRSR
jgi:hypothetical protein